MRCPMTNSTPRRAAVPGPPIAIPCFVFPLSACASTGNQAGGSLSSQNPSTAGPSTGPAAAPPPSTPATPAAPATPADYFANGKQYDAWVIAINSDGTLTIDLAHHLTGQDA